MPTLTIASTLSGSQTSAANTTIHAPSAHNTTSKIGFDFENPKS